MLGLFEQEAKDEFPNDVMLRELHIMRALKSYSNKNIITFQKNFQERGL
jgi:hypothetical protein